MNEIDIDNAIHRLLTCASDLHCKKEDDCFQVALWARDARATMRAERALSHPDQDEISDYAPGWEMP